MQTETSDQIHQEWRLLSEHLHKFARTDFPANFTTEQMVEQIWYMHQNLTIKPTYTTITREAVEALTVGDYISNCGSTRYGVPVDGCRWNTPKPIVEIFASETDANGKMFACFYLAQSLSSRISGSVKEGEQNVIILRSQGAMPAAMDATHIAF